jgi:N-acetylated-alpha-linked acidic dipeptidase
MRPPLRLLLALFGTLVGLLGPALAAPARLQEEPTARALSRRLCEAPRLAGTRGSFRAAHFVADVVRRAGFEVELDEREVLLSLPRRLEVAARAPGGMVLFERVERFDARAVPAGDVPKFNAWSASGRVEAGVVDVGRGLREDYERLAAAGVSVEGKIALARYGGSYRGVKAELAEEHGCVGALLFSDPEGDGPARGPVWPAGPWKPGWAAQRGSISPLARAPGDPSTPGWASPRPGEEGRRLLEHESDAGLPRIPCLPIGSEEALRLIATEGVRVRLDIDVPRELFRIVNVVARLPGSGDDFVVAGNHRDAWVRGAHDAGSGTVALMLAAQHLGERWRAGWRPASGIVLGFWDAEESGLIGSTEWAEAHADLLRTHGLAYVNVDSAVSGLRFGAGGSPGLLGSLRAALERVPAPAIEGTPARSDLWDQWSQGGESAPSLGFPGSGSDYTVFLHHLGLPVLDLGFGGNRGGHYHTAFDDFAMMDRFLDPDWRGHATAGATLAELLAELAGRGRTAFDEGEAARELAAMVRRAGAEEDGWLGAERAERLASAFDGIVARAERGDVAPAEPFYLALATPEGLAGRPWFKNRLWAPGLETGYASETLPGLRLAARLGGEELVRELDALIAAVDARREAWRASPGRTGRVVETGD